MPRKVIEVKLCDRDGNPDAEEVEFVDVVTTYHGLLCPDCITYVREFFSAFPQRAGGTVKGIASLEYLVDDPK